MIVDYSLRDNLREVSRLSSLLLRDKVLLLLLLLSSDPFHSNRNMGMEKSSVA